MTWALSCLVVVELGWAVRSVAAVGGVRVLNVEVAAFQLFSQSSSFELCRGANC